MNKGVLDTLKLVGIILIIVIAIYLIGRYLGKKRAQAEGQKPIEPGDLPNSGTGIPTGWTPSPLAQKMRDSIVGWNFASIFYDNRSELWQELLQLPTDDMFKAVFLDYKRMYGDSLVVDLRNEWSDLLVAATGKSLKEEILDRAQRLGIS